MCVLLYLHVYVETRKQPRLLFLRYHLPWLLRHTLSLTWANQASRLAGQGALGIPQSSPLWHWDSKRIPPCSAFLVCGFCGSPWGPCAQALYWLSYLFGLYAAFWNWCIFFLVFLYACGYVHVSGHAHRSQRHQILLDLVLQAVWADHCGCGEANSGPLQEQFTLLNPWAISLAPILLITTYFLSTILISLGFSSGDSISVRVDFV